MSERIIIEIDDTELDAAIQKLEAFTAAGKGGVTGVNQTNRAMDKMGGNLKKIGVKDLPSLNREARILLRQVPGMGNAMRQYFNLKRLMRGTEIGGTQGILSLLTSVLLISTTLAQQYNQYKELQMKLNAHELMLRQMLNLDKDQFAVWQEDLKRDRMKSVALW